MKKLAPVRLNQFVEISSLSECKMEEPGKSCEKVAKIVNPSEQEQVKEKATEDLKSQAK